MDSETIVFDLKNSESFLTAIPIAIRSKIKTFLKV